MDIKLKDQFMRKFLRIALYWVTLFPLIHFDFYWIAHRNISSKEKKA